MLAKKIQKIHPVKSRRAVILLHPVKYCRRQFNVAGTKLFNRVNWKKLNGLIPVVTQDFKTGKVLMVAFMNKEALRRTLKERKVTYWSRTRKKLWTKGETSGNFQLVREIWSDCDNDTLLIKVKQIGNVCHTGNKTCFFQKIYGKRK